MSAGPAPDRSKAIEVPSLDVTRFTTFMAGAPSEGRRVARREVVARPGSKSTGRAGRLIVGSGAPETPATADASATT
jgi:hypothetical protein